MKFIIISLTPLFSDADILIKNSVVDRNIVQVGGARYNRIPSVIKGRSRAEVGALERS